METTLDRLDFLVLVVYLVAVVGLGSYFARGVKSSEDFFLAGRSFGWFPLGLSIVVSLLSANGYLSTTGYVYSQDLQYITIAPMVLPVLLLVLYVFVPIFHRYRVTTVYQYIEYRLGPRSHLLTTLAFLLKRAAWLGAVVYVPCVPLSRVAGIDLEFCILAVGVGATVYTVLGGMKAVVWTDVLQFFVLVGGLIFMIWALLNSVEGGASGIWSTAQAGGRTTWLKLRGDLLYETTIWALICTSIASNIAAYGTDQVTLQRCFSARSLRDSQLSLLSNGLVLLPIIFLQGVLGLGLFAFYQQFPERLHDGISKDHVVVFFAANELPAGVAGIIIAAIFAATMSSVDSGINSLSTTCVVDLYRRWFRTPTQPDASAAEADQGELRLARWLTVFWGVMATAIALFIFPHAGSIVLMAARITGLFSGPLAGIFLLAIFIRSARDMPCVTAAILGWATASYIAFGTEIIFWWWSPVSCIVTVAVGWGLSVLSPLGKSEQ